MAKPLLQIFFQNNCELKLTYGYSEIHKNIWI